VKTGTPAHWSAAGWRAIVRGSVTGIEAPAKDFFEGTCFGFRALTLFPALTSLTVLPADVISEPNGVGVILLGMEKVCELGSLKFLHMGEPGNGPEEGWPLNYFSAPFACFLQPAGKPREAHL